MREFVVPAPYTVEKEASLADTVFRFAADCPTHVPFRRLVGGRWVDVSAAEFAAQVTAVAKGLIAGGVEHGDRIAIMSATRYEWVLLDYAIWTAGGVTVAIYETSSADQARWILQDSGTKILVVEHERNAEAVAAVVAELDNVGELLQIDGTPGAIDLLVERGKDITDEQVHQHRAQVTSEDPATLVYTSGTTGRPKGAQLTHFNLLAESASVKDALGDMMVEGKSTLLFLPMAHIFARVISVASFETKILVGHFADIPHLVENFAVFKPTFVLSVPRVFEKVFNTAKQKAEDGGKGKIFGAAESTAIEYSESLDKGGPSLLLKLKHLLFDKLVYGKLRAALGGQCEAAVSGGGPLGARLGHFYRGVGVTIYEGYGLTETTAAVTVNRPGSQRVGTVGQPVPGNGVRIADDGEVLLRGDVVFSGYWHNEAATEDAIRDGWFHTGDLGSLDNEGFLSITGRKKEIIVTAGGKNVVPSGLEDTLRAHALISQALVVGDAKPFIGALITLDPEAVPGWMERNGKPADLPIEKLVKDADLIAEIDAAVKQANQAVSKAEAIKKFSVLTVDFTVETGELTPTLKLKRKVIHESFADEIEAIYSK
ncbi:long-chain fatty acid--CoA ligase [Rhodococcus sp. D2-41]|uniref:AMP-dependent synthetase/ligase n=1 Tax=Speluncibacter jeojiensis TaxID=2710754 RepID=UPI00241086B7|nr:long-chain fatty acid--CoA ligase [Rhodococcus sp. D2-41]MDG3012549.1 long-chain fatty acid--CoA ligase [Rhodococcus sp. D2-41]